MEPLWIPVSLTATKAVSRPALAPAPAAATSPSATAPQAAGAAAVADETVGMAHPTRWAQVFPPPSEVNCTDSSNSDEREGSDAAETNHTPGTDASSDGEVPEDSKPVADAEQAHCERHYRADPVTVRAGLRPWLSKAECPAPFAMRFAGSAAARQVLPAVQRHW